MTHVVRAAMTETRNAFGDMPNDVTGLASVTITNPTETGSTFRVLQSAPLTVDTGMQLYQILDGLLGPSPMPTDRVELVSLVSTQGDIDIDCSPHRPMQGNRMTSHDGIADTLVSQGGANSVQE